MDKRNILTFSNKYSNKAIEIQLRQFLYNNVTYKLLSFFYTEEHLKESEKKQSLLQ